MACLKRTNDGFLFPLQMSPGEKRILGREDVGKLDSHVSRKHLEFGVRLRADQPNRLEYVVSRLGNHVSVVRRQEGSPPGETWCSIPMTTDATSSPLQLRDGDQLFVLGRTEGSNGLPPRYEFAVELPQSPPSPPPPPSPLVDVVMTDNRQECELGAGRDGSNSRLTSVIAALNDIDTESKESTVRSRGLSVLANAYELSRELEAKADALRKEEAELLAQLASAHAAMQEVGEAFTRKEHDLYECISSIIGRKQERLEEIADWD